MLIMEFKDKKEAIQASITENVDGNFSIGTLEKDGQITIYFKEDKENWTNHFTGLLSQFGFKFSVLCINTIETGDYRYSITLIFDIKNLDESDFW